MTASGPATATASITAAAAAAAASLLFPLPASRPSHRPATVHDFIQKGGKHLNLHYLINLSIT
jgi:hypothetical protein